ncbi:MAG: 2-oxoacid:acceptor oxidoreductase subunit alpha [Gemmatimonadota bacterium]|nr:MAG: 2-oxoacid:acceptor oxidoreductase subunit alpha [Gemmatimonadota bacterium]
MGYRKIRGVTPPGQYFLQGDEACAEGAVAAGCRFFAGYPITPASEVMEHIVRRFKDCDGVFVQMEDEIGSIAAMIGASWAGAKPMTSTSGPGLSLMMENIGYAAMTETPLVIVDIQRAGPSTGQATRPGSGDMLQVKYGSHGDYEIIALSPWSVQEIYDMTIRAFNLAERFRVPVFVLSDEGVGHLRENVTVEQEVTVFERDKAPGQPPFHTDEPGGVPPMPCFGDGEKLLVTGSTHDPFGYRKTQVSEVHERLVSRLVGKIRNRADEIVDTDSYFLDDGPDVLLVAYGITARAALSAAKVLRDEGQKVGLLRLRTIWPFPERVVVESAQKCKEVVVPELNQGQICREIERLLDRDVISLPQTNGETMKPTKIIEFVRERAVTQP